MNFQLIGISMPNDLKFISILGKPLRKFYELIHDIRNIPTLKTTVKSENDTLVKCVSHLDNFTSINMNFSRLCTFSKSIKSFPKCKLFTQTVGSKLMRSGLLISLACHWFVLFPLQEEHLNIHDVFTKCQIPLDE